MKGIIWRSTNKDKAMRRWSQIIRGYKACNIELVDHGFKEKDWHLYAEFANGDTWECVPAIEAFKAHRCNVSMVDRDISPNIIKALIIPCTKELPYNIIGYF